MPLQYSKIRLRRLLEDPCQRVKTCIADLLVDVSSRRLSSRTRAIAMPAGLALDERWLGEVGWTRDDVYFLERTSG